MKHILILMLMLCSFMIKAQTFVLTSTTGGAVDSVTNAGTTYLTSGAVTGTKAIVSVQVTAAEISGTTAGTLSLLGSLDGTNFKAATLAEVSTAVNTYTATDVTSQTFIWRITGNPYKYYRVSWTGTGTMLDTFSAVMIAR
jgi:hypothetical protein